MGLTRDLRQVAEGWRWGYRPVPPASAKADDPSSEEFPTEWARSPTARAVRSAIQRLGLAPLLRFELSRSVHGLDVLAETERPVVFAANHSSHLDAPLVLTSLPERWRAQTAVGAAADYFFDVWWKAAATALAFNAFPVERKGARRSAATARMLLEQGWSILVFPQGTRSLDGWITDFRAGAARLALEAMVPVVPVAITGTFHAMPRGRPWPAPGRPSVGVRFGRPVRPEPHERPRELNGRIRRALEVTIHEDATSWWQAMSADARDELLGYSGPVAPQWRRLWEASRPAGGDTRPRAWDGR